GRGASCGSPSALAASPTDIPTAGSSISCSSTTSLGPRNRNTMSPARTSVIARYFLASLLLASLLLASCDDAPRPHMEPPGPRWSSAPKLAAEGALVVLRAEGLRPVVRTLGDRSYREDTLDMIEAQ